MYSGFCIRLHGVCLKIFGKRRKHILTLTREALNLNQAQLAELAETSIFTLQSIEIFRLKLSERVAWKLAETTGIRAEWFLSHPTGPLPLDPVALKAKFEEAKRSSFEGFYRAQPGIKDHRLYRIAWLLREIANYHGGYAGAASFGVPRRASEGEPEASEDNCPARTSRKVYEAAAEVVKDRESAKSYRCRHAGDGPGDQRWKEAERKLQSCISGYAIKSPEKPGCGMG